MNIAEITKKLIGPVLPIGSHQEDVQRLSNLEDMIDIVQELLYDLEQLANERHSHQASVKAIGKRAHEALDEFGIRE